MKQFDRFKLDIKYLSERESKLDLYNKGLISYIEEVFQHVQNA